MIVVERRPKGKSNLCAVTPISPKARAGTTAQRAYYATRILLQNGFKVRNISGGMLSRSMRILF
jgi:hypothetical protein